MAESNASKLANNILTDGKFDATDVVGNITSTGIDDNATSTAITIDSSQNVGIGTASPSTKLTIDEGGEPPATGMLTLQSNSASRQLRISPPTNAENGFIDYRGGNLVFKDDGTEVARFQGSTGFEVTGTIKVSDGIYIGGTAAANKLDDYEEGTWTPTYVPDSGSFTSVTYASTAGEYTKIGNTVYFTFYIQTNAITVGSASGNVKIGGLPFAPGGGATSNGGGTVINAAYFAGDKPSYGTAAASSEINLFYSTGSTANDILLDVSDLGTGGTDNVFQMMGTYITTA
jgi:hypothetical protein